MKRDDSSRATGRSSARFRSWMPGKITMSTAEYASPTIQSDFESRPSMVRASHAAARIECEHLRGFVLLLRELQQVAQVGQPLVLERQQHAPRVGTATAPVNVDGHGAPRWRW